MKNLLLVILTVLLLTSCKEAPIEVTDEKVDTPKKDEVIIEEIQEEINETPLNVQTPTVDEEAERKRALYEEIEKMSLDERANDFINSLNSGNLERIDGYIQSLSTQEFAKAKFDAKIINVKEKSDISYVEYQADVSVTVTESETKAFENGTHSYSLMLRNFPDPGFVVFFGPSEDVDIRAEKYVPTKDNTKLFNAYEAVMQLFTYVSAEPTTEKLNEEKPFNIGHAVVHAINDNYVGAIEVTKEEFKKYTQDIYGIESKERLSEIAEWIDFKYNQENGVYYIDCAHCHHSTMQLFEGMEEMDNGMKLTFSLYSDSAYVVKCSTLTVTFENNADSDYMRMVDINIEKHVDYPVYTFSA